MRRAYLHRRRPAATAGHQHIGAGRGDIGGPAPGPAENTAAPAVHSARRFEHAALASAADIDPQRVTGIDD